MNDRIRELMIQSNPHGDFKDCEWVFEKFAELIITECLNQCYFRGMNDELYAGQLRAASYIEQHFGVEDE